MSTHAPEWTLRPGRLDELETLVRLRRILFESMAIGSPEELDRLEEAWKAYFAERMPTGAFRVFVADVRGEPVGSVGLVIHHDPPGPSNPSGRVGYIMNLVTCPAWRRRGIARALMEHVLEALRSEGVPAASLHASAEGRALYEDLGFRVNEDQPEMRLIHRNGSRPAALCEPNRLSRLKP